MTFALSQILKAAAWLLFLCAFGACAVALGLPWQRLTDTHGILVSSALYAGLAGWYLATLSRFTRLSTSASLAKRSRGSERPDPGGYKSRHWCTSKDIEAFARYWDRYWATVDLNTGTKGFLVVGMGLCFLSSGLLFLALLDCQLHRTPWGLSLLPLPFCFVAALVHTYRIASRLNTRIRELERKGYF